MNTALEYLDLAALNRMSRAEFTAAVGSTFEHSPWVAEQAWNARPFADLDALHGAMLDVVRRAPRAEQLDFLRAHPELAGREAQAGTMTNDSVREQRSAGLDALARHELDEMKRLNGEYRKRHGFPFIIAARRHTKDQIFAELRRRTGGDSDVELGTALEQIAVITKLRLGALVTPHRGAPR